MDIVTEVPPEETETPGNEEVTQEVIEQCEDDFSQLVDIIGRTKRSDYALSHGHSDEAVRAQDVCLDLLNIKFLSTWRTMLKTCKPMQKKWPSPGRNA